MAKKSTISKEIHERKQREKLLANMGRKKFFDYTLKQRLVFAAAFLSAMALLTLIYNGIHTVTSFLGGVVEPETNVIRIFVRTVEEEPLVALVITILSYLIARLAMSLTTRRQSRDPRGFKIVENGTEGSSQLMPEEEKRKVFALLDQDAPDGIILGIDRKTNELITIPWEHPNPDYAPVNFNIALFGPPGTRKTSGIILPNVFNFIMRMISMVITDPKGEIYRETISAARYMDYNIKIFNIIPGQFKNSDGWDMMKHIRDSASPNDAADLAANIFMQNTGGLSGDQFWFDGNINCLKLCMLFVAKGKNFISGVPANSKGEKRTLEAVYELITAKDMVARIETAIASSEEDEELLSKPFNIWRSHPQYETIRSGLGIRLGILQNPDLARVLSEDEISFEELNDRPTIIYVMCSDKDKTYKSILTLFTSFLFKTMTDIADSHISQRLDRRLMLIFEEMGNIGRIPDLSENVSTIRSRGIGMLFCYQTLGQLIDTYGVRRPDGGMHEWETILAGCATQLCLSANDPTGQKYFSEMTGHMTVEMEVTAQQVNTFAPEMLRFNTSERLQKMPRGRPVLMTDDIKKIKPTEILICMANNDATKEKKYYYKDHPMYNVQMVDKDDNPVQYSHRSHIPRWQMNQLLSEHREILRHSPQTAKMMFDDGCKPKFIEGFANRQKTDEMALPWFLKPLSHFFEFEIEEDDDNAGNGKVASQNSYHDFLADAADREEMEFSSLNAEAADIRDLQDKAMPAQQPDNHGLKEENADQKPTETVKYTEDVFADIDIF